MKLRRLKADGFGMLRGEWHFDPDRLNLVVDDNERGKTSLLHAIVAALYGLDNDGRRYRNVLTPLEHWRPWSGDGYRIELDLDSDGETYTIRRDFTRGTVEVWNDRGQDVTPDFATEKDGFSIGQPMLGLDADEFAKCAFWRQGELADVVPDMEKDRRASTLQARLESAADTRAGDASAIEAIQALDLALKAFDSPVLGTTITIENALKRLEGMRDSETVHLRSLEHDYQAAAGPLEKIAALDEEERSLRTRLAALEAHGSALRAHDAERRLERDAQRRDELAKLRAEAESLAPLASVPADAETALSAQAARLSELNGRVQAAATKRRAIEPERARVDEALEGFSAYAQFRAEDADTLAVRAGELLRIEDEHARAQHEMDAALQALRLQGLDPERAMLLLPRFDALPIEHGDLLRDQPRIALVQQTDVATADQGRSVGLNVLRDISDWKRPRIIAGGVLALAGLLAATLGLLAELAQSRVFVVGGGVLAAIAGGALVIATATARRRARDEARARVEEAEELLRQAQSRAGENDRRLQAVAATIGYEDARAMVQDWGEVQRFRDLNAPVHAAEQQLATIARHHDAAIAGARALLATDGEVSPEALERASTAVRQRLALGQDRLVIARRLELADAESRESEAAAVEMAQQAVNTIRAAGLEYEAGGSWSAWQAEVGAQVRRAQRLRSLVDREIPAFEIGLYDAGTLEALRAEIARAKAATSGVDAAELAAVAGTASPAEADALTAAARQRLDSLRDERELLRRGVQNVAERYHGEHAQALARLEGVEHETRRALGFRDAVMHARTTIEQVARETHRRWADFLNQRVTDLLKDVGSSISKVRFGEDLDFAVSLAGGQQAARGKAVHQLSSGARDQLHLGVRLAITEFLSRGGESMPLLIDDCFSTSDDDRTRHGMKLLLEMFSRQHQVVFVTCHRARHEALAAMDPTLWSERVHWLELRPGVTSGV